MATKNMNGKQQDAEARRVIDGYQKILERVREMQELTTTPAWRTIYDWLRATAVAHERAILTEEKTRAIVAHQEAIKVTRTLMERPRMVVDELNHYCSSMPLFATQFATRARWNEGLGLVETSDQQFAKATKEDTADPTTGEVK